MNGIPLTVVGNLTADPELRYTQNGIPVANFTIACSERQFDRATNEWKDGDTTFLRTAAWRELGEHAAASLRKGMQVVATGKLKQRNYVDSKTQENRVAYELELEDLAVSLRFGTTVFTKSAPQQQNAAATAPVAQQGAPVTAQPVPQAAPQAPAYQPAAPQATGVPQGAPQAPAQPVYAGAAVAGAQAAEDDIF